MEYILSACDAQAGRFLYIAYGSNCELETQILLSGDLGYIETDKLKILQEGIGAVERILKALIKSLERKHSNPLHQLIGRRTTLVHLRKSCR